MHLAFLRYLCHKKYNPFVMNRFDNAKKNVSNQITEMWRCVMKSHSSIRKEMSTPRICCPAKGPSRFLCFLLYSVLLSNIPVCLSWAIMAPPENIVNHATKECSLFYPGDECTACRMPQGWQSLGVSYKDICPAGYKKVEVKPECFRQKNAFCCTKGHSGSPGDCEDLVINEAKKKCAFLEDIQRCASIPDGWRRPAGEMVCPFRTYEWLNDRLACPGEFAPPMINEKRVDWCKTWGKDCGQEAADQFCKQEGYSGADTWRTEKIDSTFIMGDGKMCSGSGRCDGFSFIRCKK
jgi:hypothetical protein